jgi:sugar phosphate isomerase/epimerase
MRLGLFTPLFRALPLDAMLAKLKAFPQIEALEIGTGGWPGAEHLPLDDLLASSEAARECRAKVEDAGLSISALSCHGNPLHPQPEIAHRDHAVYRKTVKLAERMHVPVVVTFSGCPGGSAQDVTPNWIVATWPPEYSEALAWQWEQRVIPYWTREAAVAAEHGVKIALEAHPGFCVYNPATMLRLRAAAGAQVGINLDPSHLWWQGIDIPAAIAELGDAIFHFHAKDVAILARNRDVNGVLDTRSFRDVAQRSWLFRSVGWGHGELEWKQIVSALRVAGYDGVLSIEHEDALLSIDEGLGSAVAMLARVVVREPPAEAWWA